MGKIHISISDKTEKTFRIAVSKRLGYKKGNLKKALEQAMEMWIIN